VRQSVRQSFAATCGLLHPSCGSPLHRRIGQRLRKSAASAPILLYKRKGRDSNPGDRSRGLTVFKTAQKPCKSTVVRQAGAPVERIGASCAVTNGALGRRGEGHPRPPSARMERLARAALTGRTRTADPLVLMSSPTA